MPQTQHTHAVVIVTHYKRMGYVIIPKPNCSGREGINCHCRRFDLLLFCRFASICRRYDRSCRRSGCHRSMGRWRPTVMQLTPLFDGSLANIGRSDWVIQINTHVGDTVSASFSRCLSRIQKLLGRTGTQTRERKCFQSIRTV